MYIRRILFFFSSLSLCVCAACSTATFNRQMEQVSVEEFDSLRTVYYNLHDSLNQVFQTMMQGDDHKIASMQRMLDEIRKSGKYDADTLDLLYQQVQQLRAVRYDAVSLVSMHIVSQYDSMAYTASEKIIQYAEQHPAFYDSSVMKVLADDIMNANNHVLHYRLQYDRLSQEFNHFLEEHRGMISTLDSSGMPVYKRPVFNLANEYQEDEK